MKELHILNLGAGVQSTTLYLMFMRRVLQPQIDYAIFADTGEEPTPVYRHLEWLQSLNRNLEHKLFVHRSCVPLAKAFLEKHELFRDQTFTGFYQEGNGLCGN
jgi:hypothetical protein